MTRREEMKKLSLDDPRYRNAAQIADAVLTGQMPDPTAGATYFLNPAVVRQRRGGSLPHGRMAKDNQLEGIPSMRLIAVCRWIEPHYQPPHLTALLHAHACKPAKLHIWVRTLASSL